MLKISVKSACSKSIGESGVAAGVRRIEAITGKAAIDYMNAKLNFYKQL